MKQDRINETFSAFLDGEASEMDIQRLLKAMESDPERIQDWHQLSRVQGALRGDVLVDVAVQPQAQDEPTREQSGSRWSLRLGQFGVAAAVATVVIVGAQWSLQTPTAPTQLALDTPAAQTEDVAAAQARFEAQQRLNLYLREHAEAASFSSGHAVAPYPVDWMEAE
ncbi:hypothetical protein [Saccharospirillum mangrovi]|nr:hypothetical protein [Saccharospirillum mangrovi]